MSRERDRSGGMLDSVILSKGCHGPVNGKVDFVRSRRSQTYSQVPDQDTLEVGWNENDHLDMQGQSSKCSRLPWQYSSTWNNTGQGLDDGVTPCKPIAKSDVTLDDVVHDPSADPHPHNIDMVDDEMVSWLQYPSYPLDATLERSYCSEFFGELPDSNPQLLKESFNNHGAARAMRPPHSTPGTDTASTRAATADAAMMLGAGRAAGLLPQAGAEAFSKLRTLQSSALTRWPQQHTTTSLAGSGMCATTHLAATKTSPLLASASQCNPMLPPKMHPAAPSLHSSQSPPGARQGSMNFSHFSRPAALVKANLHSLAGSLHPISAPPPNARFKPQPPTSNAVGRLTVEACTSTGSSIAESTTAGQAGSQQELKLQVSVAERQPSNGVEDSRWQSAPSVSAAKDLDCMVSGDCKSTPADQETCRLSGVTSDAVLADSSGKGVSHATPHPDVQEPTITSSSGGYGTSAERPKEASTSAKRKSSEREDIECQSEDGEDESVDTTQKKPVTGRGSTTKRSRAAEVHNQSERRRRDRINEKMRALQELIPNSNKTDKASMLDEAIEYLKMLQIQLQMMSLRTGMTLPPMPPAMQQHIQMPQMTAMPSMGMGMGMVQMGLGMGMMDMGVSAQGRAVMPMQSHAGPSLNGNAPNASSLVDVHDFRYQTPGAVMDSYNFMARQHQPMQMNPALGVDKYNAYMLQQHQIQQHLNQQQQQQQHLNQQQQQQQQQQHLNQQQQQQQLQPRQSLPSPLPPPQQHHQQALNMNGGLPH